MAMHVPVFSTIITAVGAAPAIGNVIYFTYLIHVLPFLLILRIIVENICSKGVELQRIFLPPPQKPVDDTYLCLPSQKIASD